MQKIKKQYVFFILSENCILKNSRCRAGCELLAKSLCLYALKFKLLVFGYSLGYTLSKVPLFYNQKTKGIITAVRYLF